ncbi:MAG: aminotransferase class V-fold PLP-dependent enzyme [Deltaproteobacteria bacterium]|nr:aminotransferase class V-fold PLP-dependent enzyme [Deltaproteobacteria bacterium]
MRPRYPVGGHLCSTSGRVAPGSIHQGMPDGPSPRPTWAQVRAEFPIACRKVPLIDGSEATLLYLDHAASTHAPRCVLDRYTRFMAGEYANIHRGTHLLSRAATAAFDDCYGVVTRFLGGDLDRGSIVFLGNTTQAIDLVAHVVDCLPGKVITTELEHHSNDLPYRKRGPLLRARVRADGSLDLDHLHGLLGANRVKLVALTGASNVTGWMPQVHTVARMAHEHGALIALDCAQLLAHQAIDVRPPDDPEHLDFVAAAGHKAYAPFGSSFLYGPRWLMDEAPPYLPGGGTASRVSAHGVEFVASPDRHQGGTPNIGGVIALAEALRYLEQIGMDRIREHERELVHAAMKGLREIEGVTVYGPENPDERLAVLTFNVAGVSDLLAAAVLSEERGIACRNGRFCAHVYVDRLLANQGGYTAEPDATPGAVRASFGLYNTLADVERLIEGVAMLRAQSWKGRYRVLGPGSAGVVKAEFAGRCNESLDGPGGGWVSARWAIVATVILARRLPGRARGAGVLARLAGVRW